MGKIDLSKLIIKQRNDLRWELEIEHEIILPVELGGNKIITKTVEFVYYKDKKNNYWLSNCAVPDEYQGQGIGSIMIKRAIKEYGQVYFSNADRLEFNTKYPKHGYDSRYLTSEGRKFVEALIKKKRFQLIGSDFLKFSFCFNSLIGLIYIIINKNKIEKIPLTAPMLCVVRV